MIRSSTVRTAWAVVAAAGAAAPALAQQHYVAKPIPANQVPPQYPSGADVPDDMDWHTMDNGGGPLSGGGMLLEGTFGQPDPGSLVNGATEMAGGFWSLLAEPVTCWVNCDNSTQSPILNVADFTCFLQKFAAADPWANCDNSTQSPVLNVADFTCFLQKYAAGCS